MKFISLINSIIIKTSICIAKVAHKGMFFMTLIVAMQGHWVRDIICVHIMMSIMTTRELSFSQIMAPY